MNYQIEDENIIVDYGTYITLSSIKEQKKIFSKILKIKKPIIIQANNIVKIDTAAFQLLFSFIQSAQREKIQWTWKDPSYPLIHSANLLGMRELLQLSEK